MPFATSSHVRRTLIKPCLEPLETRLAPATFIVNVATDSGGTDPAMFLTGVGAGETGDLRYAIAQADNTAGADEIVFNLPDNSVIRLTQMMRPITDTAGLTIDWRIRRIGATLNRLYSGRCSSERLIRPSVRKSAPTTPAKRILSLCLIHFGPNNITDVWQVRKVNPQSMLHLTEKPVELAARAIEYSSRPGENVLDLFGGSGSTMNGQRIGAWRILTFSNGCCVPRKRCWSGPRRP